MWPIARQHSSWLQRGEHHGAFSGFARGRRPRFMTQEYVVYEEESEPDAAIQVCSLSEMHT